MTTREEVYAVIEGERNYQQLVWQQRCQDHGVAYTSDAETSVADWLIYIKGYYADAVRLAAHDPDGGDVLHVVRKLAALCVACMEGHGGWERVSDGSIRTFFPTPTCDQVYRLIDFERDYQDSLGTDRTDDRQHMVNDYLVMFDSYLNTAMSAWTYTAGDREALKQIGKLAGICVHCMEDCGAPRRVVDVALGHESVGIIKKWRNRIRWGR